MERLADMPKLSFNRRPRRRMVPQEPLPARASLELLQPRLQFMR